LSQQIAPRIIACFPNTFVIQNFTQFYNYTLSALEFNHKRRFERRNGKKTDSAESEPKQVKLDPKPTYKTETGSEVQIVMRK